MCLRRRRIISRREFIRQIGEQPENNPEYPKLNLPLREHPCSGSEGEKKMKLLKLFEK